MEFKKKLRDLLTENSLSPEQLSKKLPISIAPNTIRNYLNGNPPQSKEFYQILADFFGVSVQYLYDDTVGNREKENIDIGKTIGLSDKAIKNLHMLKMQKDSLPNSNFKMLETINLLLEEDNFETKSLLAIIDSYLNMKTDKEKTFDFVNHNDWCEMRYTFTYEDLTKILLDIQNDKLKELRNKIQSQNENNN